MLFRLQMIQLLMQQNSQLFKRFIKIQSNLKPEDIKSHRNNFVKDYLNINDSSGIAALDQKADYIELKMTLKWLILTK